MPRRLTVVAVLLCTLTAVACANERPAGSAGRTVSPAATPPGTPSAPPPASDEGLPRLPTPTREGGGSPPAGTGIQGITVTDSCPVMRDPPCPDKPIAVPLSVVDVASGRPVATVDSGSDGRFSVALAPGRYSITLLNAGFVPRLAAPVLVTVTAGQYATVTIRVDMGLR